MNVDLLAKLKLQGIYLVPSVPNTTGKTQETDQNYGQYKSVFQENLRTLSQARFDKGIALRVTDLPLLVFGGTCSQTNVTLRDSFSVAFSVERNLSCWRKCGAVPLTRAPLTTGEVRHEVPVGRAAQLVSDKPKDPAIGHLRSLEAMNHFLCDILNTDGFDGNKLRRDAPTRTTFVAVTEPHSKERIQAIKKAKAAGQMYFAIGGRHLNSQEFFQAKALEQREEALRKMEEKKKQRAKYCKDQLEAVMLLKKKGELTHDTVKNFTLPEIKTLLKWKKAPKPPSSKKADLVQTYIDAPKPKIQKVWCRSEEAELQALKSEKVEMKDTALGMAVTQMAPAVTHNLATLDPETRAALKRSLEDFEKDDSSSS